MSYFIIGALFYSHALLYRIIFYVDNLNTLGFARKCEFIIYEYKWFVSLPSIVFMILWMVFFFFCQS